jgi:hypothetical protein
MARRRLFAAWSGSPGVIATVAGGPPSGALAAASGVSSFAGAGTAAGAPAGINGVLAAAAPAASFAGAGSTQWSPDSIPVARQPLVFDASVLPGNQGDTLSSWPNLGDTALLPAMVQVGATAVPTIKQLRGLKAAGLIRSPLQRLAAPFAAGGISAPFTVFVALCASDPNSAATILSGAPTSGDTFRLRKAGTSNVYPQGYASLGTTGIITRSAVTGAGQPRVVVATYNGASSLLGTNGAADTTGSLTGPSITGFSIGLDSGGNNSLGAVIGEIRVVLNCTPQERIDMQAYMEAKWHTTAPRKVVMCKGDSNTNGFGVTVADCAYLGEMDRWGQTAPGGYYIDLIGPVQFATLANSNRCGYNGATILDHLNGSVPLNMSTPAQLVAAGYLPDLTILDIGINDANNNVTDVSATMLTNYAALLDAMIAAHPTGKIIVCSLNQSQTATTNTNINGLNTGLPAIVAARSANCFLADTGGGLGANPGTNGYFADNLHKSVAGQSKFLDVIKPVILANW